MEKKERKTKEYIRNILFVVINIVGYDLFLGIFVCLLANSIFRTSGPRTIYI